jgi:hypothetical protein
MWVWKGMPDVSFWLTASIKPPGSTPTIYYAWVLEFGPQYSPVVLVDYYRQNPSYILRDKEIWNFLVKSGAVPSGPAAAAPLVTTPARPIDISPADVPKPSAIDKLKDWLAQETIMPGYANQWFVVGAVTAYFLLRKK